MQIGEKIQQLRKAKKISLTELSEKSGVQMATLSRIENLKMTGTVESHIAIAKVLGISLAELYKGVGVDEKPVDVQTKKITGEIFLKSAKATYEMLTSKVFEKKMMPVLLRIEPGGISEPEQNPIGSEKFIFCLEGKVEAVINEKTYPVKKHTSLYFEGSLPHYLKNIGKTQAVILSIITPPVF